MMMKKMESQELSVEKLSSVVGGDVNRVLKYVCLTHGAIVCLGFYNGYNDTARG